MGTLFCAVGLGGVTTFSETGSNAKNTESEIRPQEAYSDVPFRGLGFGVTGSRAGGLFPVPIRRAIGTLDATFLLTGICFGEDLRAAFGVGSLGDIAVVSVLSSFAASSA